MTYMGYPQMELKLLGRCRLRWLLPRFLILSLLPWLTWKLTLSLDFRNAGKLFTARSQSSPPASACHPRVSGNASASAPGYYAIFDASGLRCSELQFLKAVPKSWQVLLLHDCVEGLGFKSCPRCISLPSGWTRVNVYDKLAMMKTPEVENDPVLTRMAAILYVTSLGASWIFFSDRVVPIPFSALHRVIDRKVASGLVYNPPSPGARFEPCGHFIDPYTWQNQLPLADPALYSLTSISANSVYHVIRGCLKESGLKNTSQEDVDFAAPPPHTHRGTFADSDLSNLLVPLQQAWALLFPALLSLPSLSNSSAARMPSVHADLSILFQRVLWKTDGRLGFLPARVDETSEMDVRPVSNQSHAGGQGMTSSGVPDTGGIAAQTRELVRKRDLEYTVQFTKSIKNLALSITDYLDTLGRIEVSMKRFHASVGEYVFTWVKLLSAHGVDEGKALMSPGQSEAAARPVYFSPAPKTPAVMSSYGVGDAIKKLCQASGHTLHLSFPKKHPVQDILLVVVLNWPNLVTNIPIHSDTYSRHFKHVLYCAESMPIFRQEYLNKTVEKRPVTFLEAKLTNGITGHACATAATAMGYDVKGFLEVGDDMVLNLWNVQHLPRDRPWFQSSIRVAELDKPSVPDLWKSPEWGPWTLRIGGRNSALEFYKSLSDLKRDPELGALAQKFLQTLAASTGCSKCVMYEASDIFYLPASLQNEFHFLSSITLKNNMHLEIAVPTILAGLTSDQSIFRLRGQYLWYEKRRLTLEAYSMHDHFMHAFKYNHLKYQKYAELYCKTFLEQIDKDLAEA